MLDGRLLGAGAAVKAPLNFRLATIRSEPVNSIKI